MAITSIYEKAFQTHARTLKNENIKPKSMTEQNQSNLDTGLSLFGLLTITVGSFLLGRAYGKYVSTKSVEQLREELSEAKREEKQQRLRKRKQIENPKNQKP